MRLVADSLQLSATDLAMHLGCAHLSMLDLAVAERRRRSRLRGVASRFGWG